MKRLRGLTFLFPVGFFIFLSILIAAAPASAAKDERADSTLTITVKASPASTFPSRLTILSPKLCKAIEAAQIEPAQPEEIKQVLEDTEITLERNGSLLHYGVLASGDLWEQSTGQALHLKDRSRQRMQDLVQELRSAHYGVPVSWQNTDRLIPRSSRFTVTDLETGISFRVQRRAGSSHADVQPLSKTDSRLMKQIYGGNWSWDRRAILVKTDGRTLAASMNGMPHGGDGIPGNDFKGHFCIHFAGSATHGSHTVDPGHQAMVYKAAGQLDHYLQSLAPEDMIDLFIIARNQRDSVLLGKIVTDSLMQDKTAPFIHDDAVTMRRKSEKIEHRAPVDGKETTIPVKLTVYRAKSGRPVNCQFTLLFDTTLKRWQISSISANNPKK